MKLLMKTDSPIDTVFEITSDTFIIEQCYENLLQRCPFLTPINHCWEPDISDCERYHYINISKYYQCPKFMSEHWFSALYTLFTIELVEYDIKQNNKTIMLYYNQTHYHLNRKNTIRNQRCLKNNIKAVESLQRTKLYFIKIWSERFDYNFKSGLDFEYSGGIPFISSTNS